MAVIDQSDLGDDAWATTEQVRNRFRLEIGNQNPDHEARIREATDAIQADWSEATGKDLPADLPDSPPTLLQYATAYLAASLAHLSFAQNISGENDGDQRPVFLEQQSKKMFDRWTAQADLDSGAEPDGSNTSAVQARSGTIAGDNPIQRGDDRYG